MASVLTLGSGLTTCSGVSAVRSAFLGISVHTHREAAVKTHTLCLPGAEKGPPQTSRETGTSSYKCQELNSAHSCTSPKTSQRGRQPRTPSPCPTDSGLTASHTRMK